MMLVRKSAEAEDVAKVNATASGEEVNIPFFTFPNTLT